MRALFENGTITEMNYNNHIVTMNKNKCFVVRKESNNFLIIETSVNESLQWVKNYIDNLK